MAEGWFPEFHAPLWFLVLPAAVFIIWRAERLRNRPAALFSSVADLKGLPVTFAQRVKRMLPWLTGLGLALLITALARPRLGQEETRIRGKGIAVEMAVDVSGSMRAQDFFIGNKRVTRLEAVKHVFKSFVLGDGKDLPGRPDDLIGLVSFGGFAVGRCPLTLDHNALTAVLDKVQVPEPPRDKYGRPVETALWRQETMTAVGDALALSLARLQKTKEKVKSRVLILLSDGDNNAGAADPLAAAEAAKKLGIKTYTIGVGHTGYAYFAVKDETGAEELRRQEVVLNEELLRKIAETTGGKYFNARDTKALHKVYMEIDRLEKTRFERRRYRSYRELYAWAATPGLALLLLTALAGTLRFRTLP